MTEKTDGLSLFKNVSWWFVSVVVTGIIGSFSYDFFKHLLEIKDNEIARLMKQVTFLEKEVIDSKQILLNFSGELRIVSSGVSKLPINTPEKQIQALRDFNELIENISMIKDWSMQTNRKIISVPKYESYAEKIHKNLVLDSMQSVCERYSFHLWFTEKNALNLPKPTIIGLTNFFNSIDRECALVPENIRRIQQDSWYSNLAFSLSGQIMISYPMIAERYDSIMHSAKDMLRLISEENRKLQ